MFRLDLNTVILNRFKSYGATLPPEVGYEKSVGLGLGPPISTKF